MAKRNFWERHKIQRGQCSGPFKIKNGGSVAPGLKCDPPRDKMEYKYPMKYRISNDFISSTFKMKIFLVVFLKSNLSVKNLRRI